MKATEEKIIPIIDHKNKIDIDKLILWTKDLTDKYIETKVWHIVKNK